jgi:hypothetical protein
MSRKAVIEVDRLQYNATYIGKGMYSRVYRVGDRVIYYTKDDCTKEVLSMFLQDRVTHLPEMVRHDDLRVINSRYLVFSSPYYRDVKASDKSAWKLMKKIIKLFNIEVSRLNYQKIRFNQQVMHTLVDRVEEYKELPHSIINAMHTLVDLGALCGDARFDFHKKNFGVNEYGTLIFRDPMYVMG